MVARLAEQTTYWKAEVGLFDTAGTSKGKVFGAEGPPFGAGTIRVKFAYASSSPKCWLMWVIVPKP